MSLTLSPSLLISDFISLSSFGSLVDSGFLSRVAAGLHLLPGIAGGYLAYKEGGTAVAKD